MSSSNMTLFGSRFDENKDSFEVLSPLSVEMDTAALPRDNQKMDSSDQTILIKQMRRVSIAALLCIIFAFFWISFKDLISIDSHNVKVQLHSVDIFLAEDQTQSSNDGSHFEEYSSSDVRVDADARFEINSKYHELSIDRMRCDVSYIQTYVPSMSLRFHSVVRDPA